MEETKILKLKQGEFEPENYTGCIEYWKGTKFWYKEGRPHRLDGPACEYFNGSKLWFIEGKEYSEADWKKKVEESKVLKLKRSESVPENYTGCIEYSNGTKNWLVGGKLHRLDGPAIEYCSGTKYWYTEGKLHRINGPAIEHYSGSKCWYFEGKEYTETDWYIEVEKSKVLKLKEDESIPEDYTGCIEYLNGSKSWVKKGKLHRVDGPAMESVNGNKFWYFEGKLHRLDEPAIEYVNGDNCWFKEGKRHRLDGPACEYADGRKYWFIEGKPYTETEWKKEVEELKVLKLKSGESVPEKYTGCVELPNGTKYWLKEGKKHRENDLPACVDFNGDKYWWKEGMLHRENGPAREFVSGEKHWIKEGKLHRLDGPALENVYGAKTWFIEGAEYTEIEFNKKVEELKVLKLKSGESVPEKYTGCVEFTNKTKRWYKEGIVHRENGPAIEYPDGEKSWLKEGKYHRIDGPAMEFADGSKKWFKENKIHRLDGPAVECADGTKSWFVEGNRHRLDGPACEYADESKLWYIEGKEYTEEEFNKKVEELKNSKDVLKLKTGEPVPEKYTGCIQFVNGSKHWFNEDQHHRLDGPAIECNNGEKSWFKEGEYHRVDGPAIENIFGKFWYVKGKRHRVDGPAIEAHDGRKRWFLEGKEYSEEEVKKLQEQTVAKPEKEDSSQTIVSDVKKATTRVAVEKLTTAVKTTVVKATPKKSKKTVSKLVNNSFFDYLLGASLGTVKDSLPEKMKKPAGAVSEELRVSSVAKIEEQLLNFLLPALNADSKLDNLSKVFEPTKIRAEISSKTEVKELENQELEQENKEKRTL